MLVALASFSLHYKSTKGPLLFLLWQKGIYNENGFCEFPSCSTTSVFHLCTLSCSMESGSICYSQPAHWFMVSTFKSLFCFRWSKRGHRVISNSRCIASESVEQKQRHHTFVHDQLSHQKQFLGEAGRTTLSTGQIEPAWEDAAIIAQGKPVLLLAVNSLFLQYKKQHCWGRWSKADMPRGATYLRLL